MTECKADPGFAMPYLRATLINHNLPNPTDLFNKHIMKTIPIVKIPTPWFSNFDYFCEKLKDQQNEQQRYYDKTALDLLIMIAGKTVRILDHQNENDCHQRYKPKMQKQDHTLSYSETDHQKDRTESQ